MRNYNVATVNQNATLTVKTTFVAGQYRLWHPDARVFVHHAGLVHGCWVSARLIEPGDRIKVRGFAPDPSRQSFQVVESVMIGTGREFQ